MSQSATRNAQYAMHRIIIATGGSAGHVYPALCTALEFRDQGHEVHLAGSLGSCRKDRIVQSGFDFYELGAKGLKGNVFERIACAFSHGRAIWRAYLFFRRKNPDLVIGFGGFGSFPCVVAAWILGKPVMIHEQNVKPGRANLLAARLAKKIGVSFAEGREEFPQKNKTVHVGYPCLALRQKHPDRLEILQKLNLKDDRLTILVFGGSQGSQVINRAFLAAAAFLKVSHPIQVIHICGNNEDEWRQKYLKLNIPFAIFEFYNDMASAYTASDIVVARSGAGTVAEIEAFRKPSILIPYPYAGGHQKYNADDLQRRSVAEVVEEKDLTEESLKAAIERVMSRRETINNIFEQSNPLEGRTAAQCLVGEALGLIS